MRLSKTSLVPVLPNPFENEAPWTAQETFKTSLGVLLLLPWRFAGIVLCLVLSLLVAGMASIGAPLQNDDGCYMHTQAFSNCRRVLVKPCKFLMRCMLLCLGFWHVRVLDRREDPTKQANIIVVGPHLSLVDFLLVAWALPGIPAAVGRKEMARLPAYVFACAFQLILVDVNNKASRQRCKDAIAMRAAATWTGPPLMIFAEGCITNGKVLTQFKHGAFLPGEPVTPVLLHIPPNGDWDPAWVGRNRLNPLWVFRLMCQVANHCTLEILDVYIPDDPEKSDPEYYADNVRDLMASQLGVEVTEHAYDDICLYQQALSANVRNDFSVAKVKQLFNMDMGQLQTWLQAFRKIDKDGSGYITCDELAHILGFEDHHNSNANRIFDFFDTDGTGLISYRGFVQMLALLSGKCTAASQAKLAFFICDEQGTGRVAKRKLLETVGQGFAENRASLCRPSCSTAPHNSVSVDLLSQPLTNFADDEELSFQDFCRLVDQRPKVLDAAVERLRNRFSVLAAPAQHQHQLKLDGMRGDALPLLKHGHSRSKGSYGIAEP